MKSLEEKRKSLLNELEKVNKDIEDNKGKEYEKIYKKKYEGKCFKVIDTEIADDFWYYFIPLKRNVSNVFGLQIFLFSKGSRWYEVTEHNISLYNDKKFIKVKGQKIKNELIRKTSKILTLF
jgi:hypothetical protein